MPKVSIIMGIYNCGKYLRESIDSILAQTFTDWEFVICDDGSADDSYAIAESYRTRFPEKFILLQNEKNLGLNETLNRCIKESSGEYIARQDGDDLSEPERLQTEVDFLDEHPEYAIVSTRMFIFDENGVWGQTKGKGEVRKKSFIRHSPFVHAAAMMRREALLAVGGYSVEENLLRVEDYHLWAKFYISGYVGYNIPEVLYRFRDDRDALKRRNVRARVNQFRLMLWIYRKFGIDKKYYYIPFQQLVLIFVPPRIYQYFHRRKRKLLDQTQHE